MSSPSVYFPDQSVEFGFTHGYNFNTSEVKFSNRRRQARLHDPRPERTLEGRVPAITWDTSEAIRTFITARGGNFEKFWIYAWMPQKVKDVAVGTGDGSTFIFQTPFMKVPNVSDVDAVTGVTVGATPKTWWDGTLPPPTDGFSLYVDAPGGEIGINFVTAPPNGDPIVATIRGRERIPVVLNGPVLHVDHPLRRPQNASGPADFYSIPVIEAF